MKIKTLNMIAFGKFRHRVIELTDGFNLILGGNESGKSTIQYFVEGMLFGFYKPLRKKKTYAEAYERFRPRSGNDYRGTLIMEEDDGRLVRIERDFLRDRDGVRIFDEVTGKDISEEYPYDPVNKVRQPMGKLHMTATAYNDTVNVRQMSVRSDASLAKEVRERLLTLATEGSDEVSVSRALQSIDQRKKAIGSETSKNSPYGMAMRELRNLRKNLSESESVYAKICLNRKKIQQYNKRIAHAKNRIDTIRENAVNRIDHFREESSTRLEDVQREITMLETRLEELRRIEHVSYAGLGRLQTLETQLEIVEEEIRKNDENYKQLSTERIIVQKKQDELNQLFRNHIPEEMARDAKTIRNLADTSEEGFVVIQSEQQSSNDAQPKPADKFVNLSAFASPVLLIVMTVIGLGLIVFSMANFGNVLSGFVQIFMSFIGLLAVLFAGFVLLTNRSSFGQNRSWEDGVSDDPYVFEEPDKSDFDTSEASVGILSRHRTELAELLEKYRCSSVSAFETYFNRCRSSFGSYGENVRKMTDLAAELKTLIDCSGRCQMQKTSIVEQIDGILSPSGLTDIEAYAVACNELAERTDLESKLEANRKIYESLLKQDEQLPAAVAFESPSDREELAQYAKNVEAYSHEVSRLEGENTSYSHGLEDPIEIRERIDTLEQDIALYEEDLAACHLAEDFFKKFMAKTHRDYSADLNEKIGELIFGITKKYREVRVDENLDIQVVDPEDGGLIGLDQLSGGTIDQLCLALRFSVLDLFDHGNPMPIILDDPFVQYDDDRKEEVMELIEGMAQSTQVLLFTCTIDEKQILDAHHCAYMGIGI